ncbi:MAG: hypothetical protein IKG25_05290 [Mogibacterium sp.]|nr:hypothetical protein [Mogibacterium sp.]
MKVVIDILKNVYEFACRYPDALLSVYAHAIKNGTPLPDGAEILTKDAYSDLCARAADVPDTNVGELISREEVLNLIDTAFESGAFDGRYAYENLIDAVQNLIHPLETDLISRQAAEQLEKRTEERTETHACVCISREAAEEKLKKVVDEMALIFADIREKNVDDSVCGLCEYDCDHGIDGYANECPGFERNDCFKLKEEYQKEWTDLSDIPSVEPERKTGHWEWDQRAGEYVCSECGCNPIYEHTTPDVSEIDKYRYCRWCGAKMAPKVSTKEVIDEFIKRELKGDIDGQS